MEADANQEVDLTELPWVVRQARAHVRRELLGVLPADRLEDLVLLVSEVVTNAVLHGFPPRRMLLDLRGDAVHIGVSDSTPATPVLEVFSEGAQRGRGIALVEELADRWGVEPGPGATKSVWFEIDR